MAASHFDNQHKQAWVNDLIGRAEKAKKERGSEITAGKKGENPLWEVNKGGMLVRRLPDDLQDILRISIGGGDHLPVDCNYLVLRGDPEKCLILVRKAIKNLESVLAAIADDE